MGCFYVDLQTLCLRLSAVSSSHCCFLLLPLIPLSLFTSGSILDLSLTLYMFLVVGEASRQGCWRQGRVQCIFLLSCIYGHSGILGF